MSRKSICYCLVPTYALISVLYSLVRLRSPSSSLEDNALWMRHLVGLVAQLFLFLYIFVKTLPNNRLLVPTILIFVAGAINYGEMIRALYLASLENLKKNIIKTEKRLGNDIPERIIKCLIIDAVPDLEECNKARAWIFDADPHSTRSLLSDAQTFIYELFYTRIKASSSSLGKMARAITNCSTMVAFILFCLADKHAFRGVDRAITCALFVGAFVIQIANTRMLMRSLLSFLNVKECILSCLGQGCFPFLVVFFLDGILYAITNSAIDHLIIWLWSEEQVSFNMLLHCFKQLTPRKCQNLGSIWNILPGLRAANRKDFTAYLLKPVLEDIQEKAAGVFDAARMRSLYEARGDRELERSGCRELMPHILDFQYGNTLLIWHIATEICFNIRGEEDDIGNVDKMISSKKLSDYMMYLLVKQPKLMSSVAGISNIRYEDTCNELKQLGRESGAPNVCRFCESILEKHAIEENNQSIIIEPAIKEDNSSNISEPVIEENNPTMKENNHSILSEPAIEENNHTIIIEPAMEGNNHMYSVLKDSCSLVQLLRKKTIGGRSFLRCGWSCYRAGHCRAESHVRLLSQDGEAITIIWMLMALCGIRDQFPLK